MAGKKLHTSVFVDMLRFFSIFQSHCPQNKKVLSEGVLTKPFISNANTSLISGHPSLHIPYPGTLDGILLAFTNSCLCTGSSFLE